MDIRARRKYLRARRHYIESIRPFTLGDDDKPLPYLKVRYYGPTNTLGGRLAFSRIFEKRRLIRDYSILFSSTRDVMDSLGYEAMFYEKSWGYFRLKRK